MNKFNIGDIVYYNNIKMTVKNYYRAVKNNTLTYNYHVKDSKWSVLLLGEFELISEADFLGPKSSNNSRPQKFKTGDRVWCLSRLEEMIVVAYIMVNTNHFYEVISHKTSSIGVSEKDLMLYSDYQASLQKYNATYNGYLNLQPTNNWANNSNSLSGYYVGIGGGGVWTSSRT
jgi:hypothetical protein